MRTTLSIDDDVLEVAKARARREGRTAGEVISELARRSLTAPSPPVEIAHRNGFPVLQVPGTLVTNELIDEIREEEGV